MSDGRTTQARPGARVVVVDDHPFFRDGLIRGLRQSGQFEVVGEAGDGREGLELIRSVRPDVAVLDYQMPDLDGLDVVRAVVRDKLPTRDSDPVGPDRQRRGVPGPPGGCQRLSVEGLAPSRDRRCRAPGGPGRTVVPPELTAGLADQIRLRAQTSGPVLSERERQVLQGFARGSVDPGARGRAVPRCEHGQDPYPAAVREARGLRPGGCGGRGDASRAAGVTASPELPAPSTPGAGRGSAGCSGCCWSSSSSPCCSPSRPGAPRPVLGDRRLLSGLEPGDRRDGAGGLERVERLSWLFLFVDVAALAALTLVTDSSASVSWTPYLLINGFFLIPVMAAAQLNPLVCVVVITPGGRGLLRLRATDPARLGGADLVRAAPHRHAGRGRARGDLAVSAAASPGGDDRRAAGRPDRAARGDGERAAARAAQPGRDPARRCAAVRPRRPAGLDDALDGDAEASERIDEALREATRLLRSTMSQLHPAVLDTAGLLPALRDTVETFRARGRFGSSWTATAGRTDFVRAPTSCC